MLSFQIAVVLPLQVSFLQTIRLNPSILISRTMQRWVDQAGVVLSVLTTGKKLESCEARLAQSRAAFDNLHGMSNEYFFQEHKLPISPGGLILQETMTIAEAKRRCAELSNCKGFTFPGSPTNGSIHIELKDKSELGGQGEWTSYLRADYKHLSLSSDTDTSKLEASKKVAELALADAKKSLKDVEQQLQSKDARIAVLERQNHELEQNAVKLRSSEESCKSARNSLERELNEHDEIMKQMEEVSTELKWKLDEKTSESQRRTTLLIVCLIVGVLSLGYHAKGGRKGSADDSFCSKSV